MAKSKVKRPLAADLFEQADSLIEDNKQRDALFDRLDALYDQGTDDGSETQAASDSDNVKRVTMPYATSAVDLVADLASQQKLYIEVPAASENKKDVEAAETQEGWLRAWNAQNEMLRQRNHSSEMAWLATQRAHCIVRTLFWDKAIVGKEIKGIPVLFQSRDPRHVYVQDGPSGPEYVVERTMRKAADIRRMFPDALDEDEYSADSDIEWTEYWDDTWRCYWCNKEPVKIKSYEVVPHRYGVIPYAIGMARTTPRAQSEKRYRPLLAGVERTVENIDTWYSILATAGWASVTNAWGVFSDNYAAGNKELSLEPGDVNYFATNDKLTPIQRGALPADFFQLGQLLMSAFQASTFPQIMFGTAGGATAGYAIQMLMQAGRRPLAPIWMAIERCYEQAFRNAVLIAKSMIAPLVGDEIGLSIRGMAEVDGKQRAVRNSLKLDTRLIDETWECHVQLDDPMPQDEASNARLALELVKGGLLSRATALERYKLSDDPGKEAERMAVEMIMQQLLLKEAMKLAIERGYVPKPIPEVQPPPQLPGPQQPGPQNGQPPQIDPAILAQMMAAQGGQQPPGMQGVDQAAMQQLSGQPAPVQLDQLAGVPPVVPQ